MQAAARIERIYRYPVKGLSAEGLSSTRLRVGRTLPADRLYAIENGPSGFDPAAPAYFPKQRFLMLMRNERLARLNARLDEDTHVLSIELDGAIAARGSLREPEGRAAVEGFLVDFCADELRGPPKVLYGNGHSFSDVARKVVSIISLASPPSPKSSARSAPQSTRCASAPIFMSAAGPRGTSSRSSVMSFGSARPQS